MTPVFKLPPSQHLLSADDLAILRRNDLLGKAADNTKLKKGGEGLYVRYLNLAPAWNSGYNMCVYSSPVCSDLCIFKQGRASYQPSINLSRIRKTRYFVEHHEEFMQRLVQEIERHERQAHAQNLRPVLRLNTMSDIPWERVMIDGTSIIDLFPGVTFYDYTKVIGRIRTPLPRNYSLTFSLSESNDSHALEAAALGANLAVVLRVKKGQPLPAHWHNIPVIDGDVHDFRFLDPKGVVVGLRAKGTAKWDDGGFVREVNGSLDTSKRVTFALRPVA